MSTRGVGRKAMSSRGVGRKAMSTRGVGPELTDVPPAEAGVGQNIAPYVSLTARNFFLVLIYTFLGNSQNPAPTIELC